MLYFKIDIMSALKKAGYSTTRMRRDKLLAQGTLTKINNNSAAISGETIGALCTMLRCQPSDILENVPTDEEKIKYF